MATKYVDPISRIEGHLGVKLTVDDGTGLVQSADVHGNLWRGFENFLVGRNPNDAITFTQRICGVCPLPHATSSTFAIESVYGYNDNFVTYANTDHAGAPRLQGVPAKAVLVRNLIYAAEFVMSHLTHFYHLAAPSYVQGPAVPPWTPYFAESMYHPLLVSNAHGIDANGAPGKGADKVPPAADTKGVLPRDAVLDGSNKYSNDLWSSVIKQYVKALRMRRLTFEAGALFAGRMPMTSSFVAGGVTLDSSASLSAKCTKFRSMFEEVATFVVKEHVPLVLALGALYPNYDNLANANWLHTNADSLWHLAPGNAAVDPSASNTRYGAGCGNFLAWGAFPQISADVNDHDTLQIKGGFKFNASGAAGSIQLFNTKKTDATGGAGWPKTFKNADGTDTSSYGNAAALVEAALKESIAKARYKNYNGEFSDDEAYPGAVSRTLPDRDTAGKYSWLKAPRWLGKSMEVGPFARMVVNGLYPVDETTALADQAGLSTYYLKYAITSGAAGLNPAMIGADLAVALVREGLAELRNADGEPLDPTTTNYVASGTRITGPVATWVLALKGGLSTMDRIRARALECLLLCVYLIGGANWPTDASGTLSWVGTDGWIGQLASASGATYVSKTPPAGEVSGFGVSEAPRGALAHFVTIKGGKIDKYQCVVPTTWNACPKDGGNQAGPIEQAMIGIPYDSTPVAITNVGGGGVSISSECGVEALRVAQSFDPCIACAVH